MNIVIELHDSEVKEVARAGEMIACHFSAAYVRKSGEVLGVATETGWFQEAQLFFEGAELVGSLPALPSVVWNGEFRTDGEDRLGIISTPLTGVSRAELELRFDEVHSVLIRGHRPALLLLGEPRFVEEINPTKIQSARGD